MRAKKKPGVGAPGRNKEIGIRMFDNQGINIVAPASGENAGLEVAS